MARAKRTTGLLTRLEAALQTHAPEVLEQLNRPASATRIKQLRKALGDLELPESFFDFYRWHDGGDESMAWLDGLHWLDARTVASMKAMMDGILDEGHYANWKKDEYWSKGWVAFADDGSGHGAWVIDTLGCFEGTAGQVLWAAAKEPDRIVVAPSFDTWLEYVTQVYEKGEFDEEYLFEADRLLKVLCKGYPKVFAPSEATAPSVRGDLQEASRRSWPRAIPKRATWLVQAGGAKTKHFVLARRGTRLVTWSGADEAALKEKGNQVSGAKIKGEHDRLLRNKTKAGFSFLGHTTKPKRGDCRLLMQTNSGALTAMAGDGRTLAYAKIGTNAYGAALYLADAVTGRRKLLHEVARGRRQTFVHMVDVDAEDRPVWQLNGTTQRFDPTSGSRQELAAFREDNPFNPHCSVARMSADGTRLLVFHDKAVRVLEGQDIVFQQRVPREGTQGNCYAGLSPSGRRLALFYDGLKAGGVANVAVFDVDSGKAIASVPHPIEHGWALGSIGFAPDDALLLLSDHRAIHAVDVTTGEAAWTNPKASSWAFSPDGELIAFGDRGISIDVCRAATRKKVASIGARGPWAQPHAEIHKVARMAFSRDGRTLLHATEGGAAYLWQL